MKQQRKKKSEQQHERVEPAVSRDRFARSEIGYWHFYILKKNHGAVVVVEEVDDGGCEDRTIRRRTGEEKKKLFKIFSTWDCVGAVKLSWDCLANISSINM